jgi:hypothetical protein
MEAWLAANAMRPVARPTFRLSSESAISGIISLACFP